MKSNTINGKERKLLSNTIFLYIMTFSTQLLNVITIPYLTRILGPTIYGKIGLAVAYMTYIQLILDFGFLLSATQKIAQNRDDMTYISKVITSVTIIKLSLMFFIIVGYLFFVLCGIVNSTDAVFYLLYLVAYIFNALLPDFFYRGIENMRTITFRMIILKAIFVCLIFLFVKDESDYYFVPFSLLIGNAVAVVVSFVDIGWKYKIRLGIPERKLMKEIFTHSVPFFVSRVSATFYQALNVVILGNIYGSSPVVGYYSSGDKIISLVKSGSSPIADSLYPYMVQNRNFKLIKKMLTVFMPVITVGVVIVWIFAEPLCVFLFGREYVETGNILRLLLPIAWVILPSYILGFPTLSPLGLAKYANLSNVFGMCVQLVMLVLMYSFFELNVYTLCVITSLTEVSVFLFRLIVVMKNRNRMGAVFK